MQGDEDPRLSFARAEGKLNVLSALGWYPQVGPRGYSHTRTSSRLPSEVYDVEQRTSLLRPGITRSETEEIVRTSHANRKA